MNRNRIRKIRGRLFFEKSSVKAAKDFTIVFYVFIAILAIFNTESITHYFKAMAVLLVASVVTFYLILWGEAKELYGGKLEWMRRLRHEKYAFLYKNGFELDRKFLFFDGNYKGYDFRVAIIQYPIDKKKWGDRAIISTYYKSGEVTVSRQLEEKLSGQYHLGFLSFIHHMVSLDPRDTISPDFEYDLDRFIEMLEKEKLVPLSYQAWLDEHEPEFTKFIHGN